MEDPGCGEAEPESAIGSLALLADPVRRGLYTSVRRAGGPVTRDEAAAHMGISAKLAAFHLDKLVAGRLLRAQSAARPGPARVGRRPKAYEPSSFELVVSVPPRHYDLLGEILLDAVDAADAGADVRDLARQVAHARGEEAGSAARAATRGSRLGPERALTAAATVLDQHGYEPARTTRRQLVLLNCPFHRLAERSRDLVCGLNQAFCQGLLDGLLTTAVRAELAPQTGRCCVRLHAPADTS